MGRQGRRQVTFCNELGRDNYFVNNIYKLSNVTISYIDSQGFRKKVTRLKNFGMKMDFIASLNQGRGDFSCPTGEAEASPTRDFRTSRVPA